MGFVQGVIGVAIFLLILGLLVVIHEIGHFVVARRAGVRVLEFGIGFPPRAKVLRSEGETLYTLNWLPIGGFVKLEGEDGDELDDPRSFSRAPLLVKEVILVAGVVMNLLLALVIFVAIAWLPSRMLTLDIGAVDPGSPAAASGLTAADRIASVDGIRYDAFDGPNRIVDDLRARAGTTVTLGVMRPSGQIEDVPVTLRPPSEVGENRGALGVRDLVPKLADEEFTRDPATAIEVGVRRTGEAFGLIANGLGQLAGSFVDNNQAPPPIAGPVGIARQVTDVFWQAGPIATLYLAGILSANLALVNVLPFPPLDGGRMVMVLVKAIVGRRISIQAERLTYLVGFMFLFAFLIWVTVLDVTRPLT
jgi:regulator of sigma E protease